MKEQRHLAGRAGMDIKQEQHEKTSRERVGCGVARVAWINSLAKMLKVSVDVLFSISVER